MSASPPRSHISFRFPDDDLQRIDQRARDHKLNRTEYVLRAALGELEDPGELKARLEAHERRIQRLEEFAFGR